MLSWFNNTKVFESTLSLCGPCISKCRRKSVNKPLSENKRRSVISSLIIVLWLPAVKQKRSYLQIEVTKLFKARGAGAKGYIKL